jgi:2-C-methyl-D-erythritol 2,4-cyclodiphosphate synthase
MRIGIGYDVHPLVNGRNLVLGGVTIPYDRGLDGHSDADALTHAIIDALLGASGQKDIGAHFPDTDPRYKDASSIALLKHVGDMLRNLYGYKVINVDASVICEQPRLAEYIDEMCHNIADALGIVEGDISVKASTSKGLGFIGKGEGIAAYAVALVERAWT